MRRRAVIALGMVLACCACASALDPSLDISQYAHTAWRVREGFSKGSITSIAQTPDGYLWLGTEFGLLRFDGVRTVPWGPPAGGYLSGSDIRGLLAARDGTLWIGSREGLASWKAGKLTQYPALNGQYVGTLLEDRKGMLWVGGYANPTGRLCTIQSGGAQCYGEDGSLGTGVESLYEDSGGNLWAGAANGLWRWKPGSPRLYPMPDPKPQVRSLIECDNGELLIAMYGGIRQLVDGKVEAYPLPGIGLKFNPTHLLRDRDGGLWIGTADRGLLHVHEGRTDVFAQSDGLSSNFILSLFEDREGNIWVATVDGLDRFRDLAVPTISLNQGLSNATVESVLAARDSSVWLGTPDGLNRWKDGQITIYRKPSGLPDDAIESLFQDDHGRLWVFTHSGVAYFENSRLIHVSGVPARPVLSVAGDSARNLWISQDQRLLHLLGESVVEQIPWARLGSKDAALALVADPLQGGLWLGFFQGGVAYLKEGRVGASYAGADGLGKGQVTGLQVDSDGTLWAATQGGLSRIKDGRVTTLTSKNGLPCDTIHWMIEDDAHSVWLYMDCGLVRIARSELDSWAADPKRTIQATVFDSSDGVRSHATTSGYSPRVAKSTDGKIWFLPFDGVSVIDPRHLAFNQLPPPVHIEQVNADGKSYDASSGLRLPPLVRDLAIDYTGLSFVAPEKVLFRYKLEGWDRDWQNVGNRRQAFYTNLAPGTYRFRVTAANNSGVWNETGDTLEFVIPAAWYQTNWFRALCVAAFLALLWGLYRLRVEQLQREEKKLRDAIETMPGIAFVAGADGARTFVNRRWVEYTGLSLEQSLGTGWQAAIHPDDLKRVQERWRTALASGETLEYEARLRRAAEGEYRWHLVRAVALRDTRGRIINWYGLATDIEDRKHAEQLQSQLAHINRVTTISEMAASWAHEIKQPITATVTNAETCLLWLKRDQPDLGEIRQAANNIVSDGNRAADIIDRIRSMYRKAPAQRTQVGVNEIIPEMVALLRGEANRYAVSIRTDLGEGLPRVMSDHIQLQQVLMNLMLNGIEAMKDTGGVLTIKSQVDDGRVLISVSDTGVGLPADKLDQIFNAFFTTKTQGTGMGLAISRSIVESYGGRLWATANDGRGASFHFTLPIGVEKEMSATGI